MVSWGGGGVWRREWLGKTVCEESVFRKENNGLGEERVKYFGGGEFSVTGKAL
jgi:hypothetical protein